MVTAIFMEAQCSNLILLDCYPENNRHKEIPAAHDELANLTVEDNPVVLIFNINM